MSGSTDPCNLQRHLFHGPGARFCPGHKPAIFCFSASMGNHVALTYLGERFVEMVKLQKGLKGMMNYYDSIVLFTCYIANNKNIYFLIIIY